MHWSRFWLRSSSAPSTMPGSGSFKPSRMRARSMRVNCWSRKNGSAVAWQWSCIIRNRALLGISKENDPESMAEQLKEISEASAAALQETRDIAHTLHPYQIEALGLTTAIRTLIDKFESASDIAFSLEIDQAASDVPHDAAIAIYRITQEWLTNIAKHAGATEVLVSLRCEASNLILRIRDNGSGFEPDVVRKGLGIRGIEERARMIGASLDIDSSVGAGATLTLVLDRS